MDENSEKEKLIDNIKLEFKDNSLLVQGEESVTDGSTADVEDDPTDVTRNRNRKKRKVKKKVYFRSDFVGEEESSSDDEDVDKCGSSVRSRNPADLNWMMWFWYHIVVVSVSTLHAAEFCGEKLADFFGITSPKYQYAINEYHRLRQEEREEEEREQREAECIRQRQLEQLSHLEIGENEPLPHKPTHECT